MTTLNFEIDQDMLKKMIDEFLSKHTQELTQIVGKCLKISTTNPISTPDPIPKPVQSLPIQSIKSESNHRIDNRPLISEQISDDPFGNLFPNPNAQTTRIQDRK